MIFTPEFSRPIAIEGIMLDKLRTETIEAKPAECAALAKRLDLRELSSLKAKLSIRRVMGGTVVKVEGDFKADVTQTCVISLQDVHAEVKAHFETFFTDDASKVSDDPDLLLENDEDAPEMVTDGVIDLGEVVAQYLALELDPYPRAPGVSLPAQAAELGIEIKNSPFQVLEGLKDGKKKDELD